MDKFPLLPTPLETQWMRQARTIPTITPTLFLKYLHKPILHNITKIKHITHPNGTHLMTNDEFKHYYNSPTKTKKLTLNQAKTLFCKTPCHSQCPNMCLTHTTPNTLKNEYHVQNHNIHTRPREHNTHPPPPPPLEYRKPPLHILKDPTNFPIHIILNNRPSTYKDKYKITKKFTTYLCQWSFLDEVTYNIWLPQRDLFPWNNQNTINHNILLLTQYYTRKQHQHFAAII